MADQAPPPPAPAPSRKRDATKAGLEAAPPAAATADGDIRTPPAASQPTHVCRRCATKTYPIAMGTLVPCLHSICLNCVGALHVRDRESSPCPVCACGFTSVGLNMASNAAVPYDEVDKRMVWVTLRWTNGPAAGHSVTAGCFEEANFLSLVEGVTETLEGTDNLYKVTVTLHDGSRPLLPESLEQRGVQSGDILLLSWDEDVLPHIRRRSGAADSSGEEEGVEEDASDSDGSH